MSHKAAALLILAASLLASSAAFADTTEDDVTWINQCIADNKKEGATEDVVRKYCVCMNNAMGDEETKSVTEWEKSHPDETKACDNERVALLSGVPVDRTKTLIFVLSGLMAGLGGLVTAARLGAGTPQAGTGFELDVISAVVIGGTPLTGGIGNMYSTAVGALVISTLSNGLVILGVPSEVQTVIKGIVLVLAVFISLDRRKIGIIK